MTAAIRLRWILPIRVNPNNPNPENHIASSNDRRSCVIADGAADETSVRTELAALLPGVTDPGANEQLRPAGKPEQLKPTASLNEPD